MAAYEGTYQGARFYKCDLQMGTPADSKHWRGTRIGSSDQDKRATAEAYVRRCYEVGLEVIANTDHNFASKDFIPYLRDAIDRLAKEFDYRIILFPGYEFTADVGFGCHVLALFDPDTDLDQIDHVLTDCGVPYPRFDKGQSKKSTKRLPEVLSVIQGKQQTGGQFSGIVMLPHSQAEAGLFDNDQIAEWLQAEEFKNPNLYCIEVPKPPSQMSQSWQRLLRNGPDCDPQWRRIRPISCVMSSDAKAQRQEDGADNYIGFRHTWIKMSRPSIEALRQAFLDHDSRIRFGDQRPEEAYSYPKIRAISVHGAAFLQDQEIAFSPNLTTLIGGRGTGKSTIIEYLRIALDQEGVVQGEDSRNNFHKLKGSIRKDTVIASVLEKEGQILKAETRSGSRAAVVEGPGVPELARFFPVRILSQREIYAVAENRAARLRLVDGAVVIELEELARNYADIREEIRGFNKKIAGLVELRQREKTLETEFQDFKIKLSRLKALEEPLARWKGRLAEERFFADLPEEAVTIAHSLREAGQAIELGTTIIGDELAKSPAGALVREIAEAADRLVADLTAKLDRAVAEFEQGVKDLLEATEVVAWGTSFAAEREEFEKLSTGLKAQGTDPDQYLEYQRGLREREIALVELRKRIVAVDSLKSERDGGEAPDGTHQPGLVEQLHEVWQGQTSKRVQAAELLTDGVPKTSTGDPFVKVTVVAFGDSESFLEQLRIEIHDRRRVSDDDCDEFTRAVFEAAHVPQTPPVSPTEVLADWIKTLRRGGRPKGCPWQPGDRRVRALLEWLTDDRLEELRLWRTPDRVIIELYRQDGSLVGDLDGAVSVGQRCTAVLTLILAHGDAPVVIDQPEEDLDNEFIFSELVPLLRKVKERRQVIVATHNANIPVNADAELVVALQAQAGRGQVMEVAGGNAIGGLAGSSQARG